MYSRHLPVFLVLEWLHQGEGTCDHDSSGISPECQAHGPSEWTPVPCTQARKSIMQLPEKIRNNDDSFETEIHLWLPAFSRRRRRSNVCNLPSKTRCTHTADHCTALLTQLTTIVLNKPSLREEERWAGGYIMQEVHSLRHLNRKLLPWYILLVVAWRIWMEGVQ